MSQSSHSLGNSLAVLDIAFEKWITFCDSLKQYLALVMNKVLLKVHKIDLCEAPLSPTNLGIILLC